MLITVVFRGLIYWFVCFFASKIWLLLKLFIYSFILSMCVCDLPECLHTTVCLFACRGQTEKGIESLGT